MSHSCCPRVLCVCAAAPYAGLCLEFVRDAYAAAGISKKYLEQGSAKDGCAVASGDGGWNTGGTPPLGAVLFWCVVAHARLTADLCRCLPMLACGCACLLAWIEVPFAVSELTLSPSLFPLRRKDCSSNGHAALSRGGGQASSSGDGVHWNGSPNVAISWLDNSWCGGGITGWYAE